MPDVTLILTGAAGVSTVTPRFDFPSGTVKVEVEDVYIKDLTSGVEDSINLAEGEKLEYICSDYNAITRIDIANDKISGDISGWSLPDNLLRFYVQTTSVSGDISGWVLPSNLVILFASNTSVSGDISSWILPSSLIYFDVNNTSVLGDISDWTLPSSLTHFYVNTTSISGDISGWTLPSSLRYFFVYTTQIDYDSTSGAFTGVTDNLTKIDFDNCSLTRDQVDNALADLVTSAIEDKTLDIGDNNSGPSFVGWANKLTLEARGWTVKINENWISPTGFVDSEDGWNNEVAAYDDDEGTYTYSDSIPPEGRSEWFDLTHPGLNCDKVRFKASPIGVFFTIYLYVYYEVNWHLIYTGSYTSIGWNEKPIPAGTKLVTAMRLHFENNDEESSGSVHIYEADFNQVVVGIARPLIDNGGLIHSPFLSGGLIG